MTPIVRRSALLLTPAMLVLLLDSLTYQAQSSRACAFRAHAKTMRDER